MVSTKLLYCELIFKRPENLKKNGDYVVDANDSSFLNCNNSCCVHTQHIDVCNYY